MSSTDSGLAVAIVLGGFTVLFGAWRLDGRERHQGMMSAIALESVVKLLAFFCVAMLALTYLRHPDISSSIDWGTQSQAEVELSADFYTQILISACAIFCLPRQFQLMVVEAQNKATTGSSRWAPVKLRGATRRKR